MFNLIIDTCVWINLVENYPELIEKLEILVAKKRVRLIVPLIIKDEWSRNKQKALDKRVSSAKGDLDNARTLKRRLSSSGEIAIAEQLIELFDHRHQISSDLAQKDIGRLDQLISAETSLHASITDWAKSSAVEHALARKAPFHKGKNSIADALLLFSAIDAIKGQRLGSTIFVTTNTNDFSSSDSKNSLHNDLEPLFTEFGIEYSINIGSALNRVEEHVVPFEVIQEIMRDQEIQNAQMAALLGVFGKLEIQALTVASPHNLLLPHIPVISPDLGTLSQIIADLARQVNVTQLASFQPLIDAVEHQNQQFAEAIRSSIAKTDQFSIWANLIQRLADTQMNWLHPLIESMEIQNQQIAKMIKLSIAETSDQPTDQERDKKPAIEETSSTNE